MRNLKSFTIIFFHVSSLIWWKTSKTACWFLTILLEKLTRHNDFWKLQLLVGIAIYAASLINIISSNKASGCAQKMLTKLTLFCSSHHATRNRSGKLGTIEKSLTNRSSSSVKKTKSVPYGFLRTKFHPKTFDSSRFCSFIVGPGPIIFFKCNVNSQKRHCWLKNEKNRQWTRLRQLR